MSSFFLDVFHLTVSQEVYPEHQEWSSSLVQEVPEHPHIKVEQEDLHHRVGDADESPQTLLVVKSEDEPPQIKEEHEYAHDQRPEDAHESPHRSISVKSEAHNENTPMEMGLPTSISTEHAKRQDDVENSGSLHQSTGLSVLPSHCSESDTEDSDEWEENRLDQAELNILTSQKSKLSNKLTQQTSTTSHKGEKPFGCNVCGKGFTLKGNLKKHMVIHTGEWPYTCKVCGKGFICNVNIKSHMMIHTGLKPHSCNVCSKGFSKKSELKRHMRIHTGEMPYSCKVCGKGFSRNDKFRLHMMLHTGEKPYSCKVCGKGFNRNDKMKSHMIIHTRERSYNCI